MRVLVIGAGGREHALAWKLAQSKKLEKLYAVPGNGGLAELAECVDVAVEPVALADFAAAEKIDFTVVGPEAPLVAGVVDEFKARGLAIFGPNKQAARLEGSKSFAKSVMRRCGVPTASAEVFTDLKTALSYVEACNPPFVVKADGLAAGKGVVVAPDKETAAAALRDCFVSRRFGAAGAKVLIEDFLSGPEVSLLALCDGRRVLPLVPAQDYKRLADNDQGPNTGGMGSYSPVPIVDEDLRAEIVERIIKPTIDGLAAEGIIYQGLLYAGVMLTGGGPKVLEFNVRFGDPETQAILPRLESDLLDILWKTSQGRLDEAELCWRAQKCVSLVMASEGYPTAAKTGRRIEGVEAAAALDNVLVFQAATKRENGALVTTGGRVLNVSALGNTFTEARERAYEAARLISFAGAQYRRDIGVRAIVESEN